MIVLQSCSTDIKQSKTKISRGSYHLYTILKYDNENVKVWAGFYSKSEVDSAKKAMKYQAKTYIDYYNFKKLQK